MIVNELDLTGKELSNYKVMGKLGKGGMATVYQAHELSLNRVVALKVLSPQLSEEVDYIKRFQREAQAAAQLNHPNIVQIFAIGEEKGIYYFAMEYIKGKSLAQIKQEQNILPPGNAVPIVRQVADALAEAHNAGLVHRDIKPSNIMIDAAGRAKVTDFGIAYITHAQTKLTKDGSIIGTPEYLSPEQCEGKTVDRRSDIYSLGVTLYELLSGKTPYEADTPVSMLMKIVKGDFPPIQEVNPNVPQPLRDIVEKMMQRDVQVRYQRMEEVIDALREFESAAPVPTTMVVEEVPVELPVEVPVEVPAQPPAEAAVERKSNKWAAVIVAAVIVILMGGAFAAKMLYFDKQKSSSTSTSTQEEKATSGESTSQPAAAAQLTGSETQPAQETGSQETTDQGTTAESNTTMAASSGQSSETGTTGSNPASGTGGTFFPAGVTGSSGSSGSTGTTGTSGTPANSGTMGTSGTSGTSGTTGTSGTSGTSGTPGTMGTSGTQPAATRPVSPIKPLPPAKSCLITAVGNEDTADLVAPYIEEILAKRKYTVIDGPSVSGEIADVARNHIVVTAKQTGSTTLSYYGKSSEMYTVRLTVKVVDPRTGKVLIGPLNQMVEYTALNSQEKFKEAVISLMSRILPVLESQNH